MINPFPNDNSGLFQTERVCRQQFRKWEIVFLTGRKRSGKRRNCTSQAISSDSVFKRLIHQKPGLVLERVSVKVFASNKLNVGEMMVIVCETVENIVGKGENAGNQVVKGLFSEGSLKLRIVWYRVSRKSSMHLRTL